MIWSVIVASAVAGYGDAVDGTPSPPERELHVWTDAARVDVGSFQDELKCWADVTPDQRAAHAPLAWSAGLAAAAVFHAQDMNRTGTFSHSSSDGTSFVDRLGRYYHGSAIGENIALGMGSARAAVLAWLCSEGHRANLLSDEFTELGTGNASRYWVQDFGHSNAIIPVLRTGAHAPADPAGTVTFYADVGSANPPDEVDVVLDGDRLPLDLAVGDDQRGIWSTDTSVDPGCHLYWFEALLQTGSVARFPEEGGYGFGDCTWDDARARWVGADQVAGLAANVAPPGSGCGCAMGGPGGGWGLAIGLAVAVRRRRSEASRPALA